MIIILRKLQLIRRPTGGSTRNDSSLVLCAGRGDTGRCWFFPPPGFRIPSLRFKTLLHQAVCLLSVVLALLRNPVSVFLGNKKRHKNLSEPPNLLQINLPTHYFQAPLAFEVKFCYTLRLWLSESQCITELCLESFLAATRLGVGGKNRPFKSFERGPQLVGSFSTISI